MTLNVIGEKVEGTYYYLNIGQPIVISGSLKNSVLKLSENIRAYGYWGTLQNADFSGTIKDGYLTGIWISKNKKLRFTLKQINETDKSIYFENRIELKHVFSKRDSTVFPISVRLNLPNYTTNRNLYDSIVSNVFDCRLNSVDIWDCFNNYALRYFQGYAQGLSYESRDYFEENFCGLVYSASKNFFTYKLWGFSYSGGAHGYAYELYHNYDIPTGKTIKLKDIINNDSIGKIAKLIFEQDNKKHTLKNIQEHLDNFYITEKGIGFVFNPTCSSNPKK